MILYPNPEFQSCFTIKILQFSELFHQAEPLSFNHATFNTLDTLKALEDFHGQALKPVFRYNQAYFAMIAKGFVITVQIVAINKKSTLSL